MATSNIMSNKKLLWSNPSPNVAFTPKTINVDLSKYSLVFIDFKFTDGGSTHLTFLGTVGMRGNMLAAYNYNFQRRFNINSNSVVFEDGYKFNVYGGNETVDNEHLIPFAIYGLN